MLLGGEVATSGILIPFGTLFRTCPTAGRVSIELRPEFTGLTLDAVPRPSSALRGLLNHYFPRRSSRWATTRSRSATVSGFRPLQVELAACQADEARR